VGEALKSAFQVDSTSTPSSAGGLPTASCSGALYRHHSFLINYLVDTIKMSQADAQVSTGYQGHPGGALIVLACGRLALGPLWP